MSKAHVHLIVMTRLPVPGTTKTRLIPQLGAEGAADLHSKLARHSIGRASAFCRENGYHLTISLAGGTIPQAKEWLCSDAIDCRQQSQGDLGKRLLTAVETAFHEGAGKVLVIGTDCPAINGEIYESAISTLEEKDIALGPALDGGYYLIGLRQKSPELFKKINWGTESVFQETQRAAKEANLTLGELTPLSDVDLATDLPAANTALQNGQQVSVIIPTLNEAESIGELLANLKQSSPHEIIIADGGSTDITIEIAEKYGAKIIHCEKGRANQMNSGAKIATGEHLLFLHSDTIPPTNFTKIIAVYLQRPGIAAGAFRFSLAKSSLGTASLIEALTHLRCFLFHTPYGDQGIFLRRSTFIRCSGFPKKSIAEDLCFIRKIKGFGKVKIVREMAITSGRRWKDQGVIRTFLRHQLIAIGCLLHLPDTVLARIRP